MSRTIQEMNAYLEETAEELNSLMSLDVMEMYRFLTEAGEGMDPLPASDKTDENFVKGCVSNVYIAVTLSDGLLFYRGSSEALIIRGYVAILVNALSGLSPLQVIEETRQKVEWFADSTNIRATLTPSRANAFGNIYKLMVEHARRLA